MRLLHRTTSITVVAFATILLIAFPVHATEPDGEAATCDECDAPNEDDSSTSESRPESDVEVVADVEFSGTDRIFGETGEERFQRRIEIDNFVDRVTEWIRYNGRMTESGPHPPLKSPSNLLGTIEVDLRFSDSERIGGNECSQLYGSRRFEYRIHLSVQFDFDFRWPARLSREIRRSWEEYFCDQSTEKPEPELNETATMEIVFRLENWPDDAELDFEVENLGSADLAPQVTEHLEEYRLTAKYCAFGLEEMEDSSRPFTVRLHMNPYRGSFYGSASEVLQSPFVDSPESSPAEYCLTNLLRGWEIDDIELTEDDGVKIEFVFP